MDEQTTIFKPVKRELIHAKIADAILEYIKGNHLTSGDKLPPERQLAEQFATSRNSVREALRVLEANGIVEIRQGSGIFVCSREESHSFYVKLWQMNYIELLEVKSALELPLLKPVCGKLKPEQLSRLEEQLLILERRSRDGVYDHKADRTFHNILWEASGNKTMMQFLKNIFEELRRYWQSLEGEESIWLSSVPCHRQMFEALRDGCWEEAEEAVMKIAQIDKDITIWLQKVGKPFK